MASDHRPCAAWGELSPLRGSEKEIGVPHRPQTQPTQPRLSPGRRWGDRLSPRAGGRALPASSWHSRGAPGAGELIRRKRGTPKEPLPRAPFPHRRGKAQHRGGRARGTASPPSLPPRGDPAAVQPAPRCCRGFPLNAPLLPGKGAQRRERGRGKAPPAQQPRAGAGCLHSCCSSPSRAGTAAPAGPELGRWAARHALEGGQGGAPRPAPRCAEQPPGPGPVAAIQAPARWRADVPGKASPGPGASPPLLRPRRSHGSCFPPPSGCFHD